MDDVFVYFVKMPPGIKEFVTPCIDGYTVYIDEKLDDASRIKEYHHALKHIRRLDFEGSCVGTIETNAHKEE